VTKDADQIILNADIPPERLLAITKELSRSLSMIGFQTKQGEVVEESGTRGDPITVGVLLVDLITAGSVTALIECFKAFIGREKSLSMTIKNIDGEVIEIAGKNIDSSALLDALKKFVSASRE
jgi:hypothetical protein